MWISRNKDKSITIIGDTFGAFPIANLNIIFQIN